ncbi:MAG: hypothetical protein ACRBN8_14555 [Nannocystales bacterium]
MKTNSILGALLLWCPMAFSCSADPLSAADTETSSGGSSTTSGGSAPTTPGTGSPGGTTTSPTTGGTTEDDDSEAGERTSTATETGIQDETAPVIVLTAPRDGASVATAVWTFEGTVSDDPSGIDTLSFDGGEGPVEVEVDEDGTFAFRASLTPGTQTYSLIGTDNAGNEGVAEASVHFGHRVSVGNSQAAFIRDGVLYTWGRNELGQLGNGTLEGSGWGDDPETAGLPVRYAADVDGLVSVVTRQTFMLGLREDGQVLSWGSNGSGQLGRESESDCGNSGTSACGRTPAPIPGLDNAIAINAGFDHSLVLHADGSVWTFGDNLYGQLGSDTGGVPRMQPAAIDGLSDIIQVAAGSDVSYALTAEGRVYAWGENDRGQLGLGNADGDAHPVPTLISNMTDVVHVAAANTTAFALLANGTLLAWGRNHAGQAGVDDESGVDVLSPSPVVTVDGESLADVVSVSGDGFVGLALTADGHVYAWGLGALGQLGQGFGKDGERDLADRLVASEVEVDREDARMFDILELEGGAGGPSLALSEDGDLFGWGWSFRGSLGLEGAINAWAYSAPILVFAGD